MSRKPSSARVREPIQIYITPGERRLLDRLAEESGISRAEVLRRGLRSFAKERSTEESPMLRFIQSMQGDDWPADIGREHDRYLEEAARDAHAPRKAKKK